MPRDPLEQTDDVRAFLDRLAAETPGEPAVPGRVIRRAHRRIATTIVGGVLAVALLSAGAVTALERVREWGRTVPADTSTPPPSSVASPPIEITGRFDEKDIRRLVLLASDRPSGYGLRHDPSYSEYESLTQVGSTLDIHTTELAQAGFVTAYFNGFLSDAWGDPSAPSEERIDLVSYAILFPDAEAARDAFGLFRAGPTTSQTEDWTSEPLATLGEEGMTSNGLLSDVPTTTVVWRVDNVVLFVSSQGYAGAIPLDELLPIAERIDGRAA